MENTNNSTVVLDTWEGHLVLMCKGWYMVDDVSFFEATRRLWAVRCGLPINCALSVMDEHIADALYKIMMKSSPSGMKHFYEVLHREIGAPGFWRGKPEGMTPIQGLIWEYRRFLHDLKIRDTDEEGNKVLLVSLPEPHKRTIRRIVKGRGEYGDYEKLTKADIRREK